MKSRFIGVFVGIALVAGVALTANYTKNEALNMLASQGQATGGLTDTEALNVLVSQQSAVLSAVPAEHDTLTGVIAFVWDDNSIELSIDSMYVESMRVNGLVGGLAFEPQNIIYGDTLTSQLSIWDARALQGRGWDIGTVGWDETSGLYNGDTSLLAQGYTQAQADTFYNNIYNGVLAQRDTLGLGAPRWLSHSNSSASWITNQAVALAGIPYGYAPTQSVTGSASFSATSGQSPRPNELFNIDQGRWGIFGTGGAQDGAVAAAPGRLGNRYEILQTIGESNNFAQWKRTLDRAAQTKGLAVMIAHRPSVIATTTGVSFDSLCTYIKTHYIDTGLLRCMTPGDAADYYYRDTFSPQANFAPGRGNFDDIDGDGHLDGWFSGSGNGTLTAADTAFIKPWGAATAGHNGKKAYSLAWAGEGNAASQWAGQTADASHESAKACLAVFPPAGAGWIAQFEAWVIADSVGASYSGVSGDTLGVSFGAPINGFWNKWGGAINLQWRADAAGSYMQSISHGYSNTAPGNLYRLGSRNKADLTGANKEWGHIIGTWEVPAGSSYLFISIWKTAQSPINGIVISDYSVTFYRRGN